MPGQNSDGSIIIDTRIDTSGFNKGSSELQKATSGLNRKFGDVGKQMQNTVTNYEKALNGSVRDTQRFQASLEKARSAAEAFKEQLRGFGSTLFNTDDFKWVEKEIEKADQALQKLLDRQEKMRATGVKENSRAYRALEYDIERAREKLDDLKATKDIYETSANSDFIGEDTAQYERYANAIAEYEEMLAQMESSMNGVIPSAEQMDNSVNMITSSLLRAAGAAAKAAVGFVRLTGRAIVDGMKKLWQFTKNATKAVLSLGKATRKNNLSHTFRSILRYGLGIRSVYALVNKLRNAVKEGFGNLAQYSDEANEAISKIMSSLTKLKNQFAAALAPVVEKVAPMLTGLIDSITAATEKVAMLTAALTGKKTFTRAKDVQEDYADSLDNTAKKAKEAKRQLAGFDELEILKKNEDEDKKTDPEDMFEEVDVPEDVEKLADELKDALEDSDWTPIGRIIGDKIKKALDGIDWDAIKQKAWEWGKKLATLLNGILETPGLFYKIGQTLAEAINTAFSFLDGFAWNFHWDSLGTAIMDAIEGVCDTLDWRLINHALQGLAAGLATTINTIFARRETWEKVGKTFGEAINAIVSAGLTFLNTVNFLQIGTTIAACLNSAIKTIKWADIGKLLASYIAGLFETIYALATEFDWAEFAKGLASGINAFFSTLRERLSKLDWKKVGQGIADGINNFLLNVNWQDVSGAVSDAIKAFLDLVLSLLININWQALGDAVADLILGIDWLGVAKRLLEIGVMLIAGLLQGMMQAVARIGIWIKQNIIDPIVNWFKKLLGIHSPSTVMAEIGGYLIEGLFKGITDGAKNITKVLKTKVVQPIQKFFKDPIGTIKLAVDNSWEATQKVWDSVQNTEVVKTITGAINRTFTAAQETYESLKSGSIIKTVGGLLDKSFETAKNTFTSFVDGSVYKHVKGVVDSAFNTAKATFDAFIDGDVFKHIKGKVEDAFNTAKNTFDAFRDMDVFKHIRGTIEEVFNTTKATFDAFVDGDVFKHIKGKVEEVFNSTKGVFDAFVDGDVFKIIKGKVDSLYTNVKNTFDSWVNGDVFKIAKGEIDNLYTSVKNTFDSWVNGDVLKIVKGKVDSTFTTAQQTFNSLTDAPVIKTIKAAVEKAGTWIAEAWTAAQMTASTVTHTVRSAVEKASSWVADAWTALSLAGQTLTTTVKAQVQQYATSGSYWVADAWTALKNAGQSVTTTVKAAVQQYATSGSYWVKDAWTALQYAGQSATATVKTALEKASSYSWNDDAWKALNAVGKTQATTLEVTATRRSNYGTEAQTWAALTGDSVIKKTFEITVSFVNSALQSVKNWLGLKAIGGILAGGSWRNIPQFARGGRVNAYAGGTTHAHGSLFLAGEAGPEVVGHINGRTEVLNKSQIASAIYSAVLAGMESAVNGLGKYIATCMINCTNAIIAGMLAVTQITGAIPVQLVGEDATLMKQLSALTGNVTYTVPAFSTGSIMPYEIAALVERSTARLEGAIGNAAEEITQSNIAALASLAATLVSAIQQSGGRGSFDTSGLVDETINEINRRTLMYNRSPLL